MGTTTIASKIDEDSELLERFEEFEEETGYANRSKALRAALRRGLDQYEGEVRRDGRRPFTRFESALLEVAAVIAGVVLFIPVFAVAGLVDATMGAVIGFGYLALAALVVLVVDFRARQGNVDIADGQEVSG